MTVNTNLAICVINGYPTANRQVLADAGVSQAHDLYVDFVKQYTPNAKIDIFYIADLDQNLPSGTNLNSYDAYIWTGSNLTIFHHDDARVTRQIEFCRAIYNVGKPQYGSCWGVQMAATAAGGEVQKNPKGREWSIARDIQLTDAGKHCKLYVGKPSKFDGFIMHLDHVTRIPEGGTLLATNAHTQVQALEVKHDKGTFWATQYHPEYNLYEMARLLIARKQPITDEGFFKSTDQVEQLAAKMLELYKHPESKDLRAELKIGDDILGTQIRQQELRNWVDYLVLPALGK
ncbi:GMP synthase (glutamine-hydrolysing) [Anaerolineae bacterium]|nr:GMP synthase (glutamine-hydrolysing) [Anaerolineae bacterium]